MVAPNEHPRARYVHPPWWHLVAVIAVEVVVSLLLVLVLGRGVDEVAIGFVISVLLAAWWWRGRGMPRG